MADDAPLVADLPELALHSRQIALVPLHDNKVPEAAFFHGVVPPHPLLRRLVNGNVSCPDVGLTRRSISLGPR